MWSGAIDSSIGNVQTSTSNIVIQRLSNSKCNIHIQCKFTDVNPSASGSVFYPIKNAIKKLGINNISFVPNQTYMRLINRQTFVMDEFRSSWQINENGEFGRQYYYNGNSQGWGSYEINMIVNNIGAIKTGDLIAIDIYGATYN